MDVYMAKLDELRELAGSKDDGVLIVLRKSMKRSPWSDYANMGGLERGRAFDAAVRWLVMGGPAPKGEPLEFCGHALRMMCSVYGTRLDDTQWGNTHARERAEVDKALKTLGSKVKLARIMTSGPPFEIPTTKGAPVIGTVRSTEASTLAVALAAAIASNPSQAGEQCEMKKGNRTWTASIVGTDLVQVVRKGSTHNRKVLGYTRVDAALRMYESCIKDRKAEGFTLVSRTRAQPGAMKRPAVNAKVMARIEEARDWFTLAAKKKQDVITFLY
jgi:hypothetical protein